MVALFSLGPLQCRAGVIFSDLGPGGTYYCCSADAAAGSAFAGGGIVETASSFVPGENAVLDQIDLALGSSAGYSDAVIISLTTDNNGLPGSALESWSLSGFPQFQSTSNLLQTLVPTGQISLSENTMYWILEAPAATNTYATWNTPNGAYANGTITDFYSYGVWRTNNPNVANNFGVPSTAFDVLGTPTPEPQPQFLVGLGIVALAATRLWWSGK